MRRCVVFSPTYLPIIQDADLIFVLGFFVGLGIESFFDSIVNDCKPPILDKWFRGIEDWRLSTGAKLREDRNSCYLLLSRRQAKPGDNFSQPCTHLIPPLCSARNKKRATAIFILFLVL